MKKGNISVNTENIFPIIKKFLYSDHEIFLRELVSNATDACQKLKTLKSLGEFKDELGDLQIEIKLDEKAKTLTISDNGIGMTADEIEKYINQLAFSGAEEFVEKYKDKAETGIIGHFGLGFYSAFMVADKVEIQTLSYQAGAESAHWTCTGSTEYKIAKGKRKTRGTDIILHLNEDSLEFNSNFKISGLLEKYCKFLPVSIKFEDKEINNTKPLWMRNPSELTDEDYTNFYKELHPMAEAPLFWIHMNVDFPFNLTGILYFPKIKTAIEADKHKVQLYCNQVYVTDNVKDILPEYLTLLHGVIDSPDIPLNVSRSSLQADGNVKKITGHISKKVADKLSELFKSNRADFETKWEYIDLFIKYGMLSDEKFADRVHAACLIETSDTKKHTLLEFEELSKANQVDKDGNTILLYTNNHSEQYAPIRQATDKGYVVAKLEGPLDSHFTGYLEQKIEKTQCRRVDSAPIDELVSKDETTAALLSEDESKALKETLETLVDKEKYTVETSTGSSSAPLLSITEDEFMRRMTEMSRMGGNAMFGAMPSSYKLVLNTSHPKAKELCSAHETAQVSKLNKAISLAMLSKGLLKGEDLYNYLKAEEEAL